MYILAGVSATLEAESGAPEVQNWPEQPSKTSFKRKKERGKRKNERKEKNEEKYGG